MLADGMNNVSRMEDCRPYLVREGMSTQGKPGHELVETVGLTRLAWTPNKKPMDDLCRAATKRLLAFHRRKNGTRNQNQSR